MRNMIWDHRKVLRMDFRFIPVILALMGISLLIMSSYATAPLVKQQSVRFAVGWAIYLFFAGFDYNRLRECAWIFYAGTLLLLIGLFFTHSIQSVHRWYRLPLVGVSVQPSEFAKLAVVITLSWFLERHRDRTFLPRTVLGAMAIVGIPFLLILKQPDLGSAMVLYPITLVMFYYGDLPQRLVQAMAWGGGVALLIVALFFTGTISHEEARPLATTFMKEYQYERLNPDNHHQRAARAAIAIGGLTGTGWQKSEYTARGWLPTPYTDSVFASFAEEFGFFGLLILLLLLYALIYFSFQVTAVAKNHFGRLLSAGIAVYLAMHILVNIGMMVGFLPITGVPLVLVTYGGSSILLTMMALGILQSIYTQRFMF